MPVVAPAVTQRQRLVLVAVLAVAAAARVAWVLYSARGTPIGYLESGDQYSYYFYGRQFADGGGYTSYLTGEPTAYYPVGYPLLLAGLFWLVLHTPIPNDLPLATGLVQAALGTGSVALVFVVARRAFDVRTGLTAAAITAVLPNVVFYSTPFMLETTFTFLTLAAVAVLVTHDWSTGPPSRNRLLTFGAVLGVGAVVRPFGLPVLFAVPLAILLCRWGWRQAVKAVAWSLLPLVLILTPWTIRNVVVMDSFVVFSTNMGDTVCIDRSPGATGTFRFATHSGCVDPNTPEAERNSGNTRKAIDYVVDHPLRELRQIPKRAWYMFRTDHDALQEVESTSAGRFLGHRVRSVLADVADAVYFATLALGVLGLPSLFRGRRPERLCVAVALLGLVAIPLGLWGNVRFHVPVLPFLAMVAAVPLSRIRRPGRRPDPVPEDGGRRAGMPAPTVEGAGRR